MIHMGGLSGSIRVVEGVWRDAEPGTGRRQQGRLGKAEVIDHKEKIYGTAREKSGYEKAAAEEHGRARVNVRMH